MESFRQCFEMTAECKKTATLFSRFSKKYPKAWEVWGEVFEYMSENGLEHYGDVGWTLWLYDDMDTRYMAKELEYTERVIAAVTETAEHIKSFNNGCFEVADEFNTIVNFDGKQYVIHWAL